jgi:plasmid stability protein
MAKTIQVRDVDDDTHRVLTARAEAAGLSLSQYLRREFRWMVGQPTVAEVLDRAERRPIAVDAEVVVAAVRSGRERP